MAFLSMEKRKAGSAQLRRYLRLIDDDIATLREKDLELYKLRRAVVRNIETVEKSINGTLDVDDLQQVDIQTNERMLYGIPHYPVKVVSGDRTVVIARVP